MQDTGTHTDQNPAGHTYAYVKQTFSGGAHCTLNGERRAAEVGGPGGARAAGVSGVRACVRACVRRGGGTAGDSTAVLLGPQLVQPEQMVLLLPGVWQLLPLVAHGHAAAWWPLRQALAPGRGRMQVRYTCMRGQKENVIASVREFPTCRYVIMVSTPFLCDHPAFKPEVGPWRGQRRCATCSCGAATWRLLAAGWAGPCFAAGESCCTGTDVRALPLTRAGSRRQGGV